MAMMYFNQEDKNHHLQQFGGGLGAGFFVFGYNIAALQFGWPKFDPGGWQAEMLADRLGFE